MARQNQARDNSQESDRKDNERAENTSDRGDRTSSPGGNDDESISTADDTANGKGSKTAVRKEEKEANDNYDKGRA